MWRRWVFRCVLCMCAGLTASIIVALCGDARSVGGYSYPPIGRDWFIDGGSIWFAHAPERRGLVSRFVYHEYQEAESFLARQEAARRSSPLYDENRLIELSDHPAWVHRRRRGGRQVIYGFGWPRRCLNYSWRYGAVMPRRDSIGRLEIPAHWMVVGGHVTGCLPIWSGLIVNTAFYASFAGVIVLGVSSARRFMRARQGVCRRCGYDLAGVTDQCPECGAVLRRDETSSDELS